MSFACVMADSSTLKNSETAAEGLQFSIFVHLCLLSEMNFNVFVMVAFLSKYSSNSFYIFIHVHIHIYKCIHVFVFALAVTSAVAVAFFCVLLAMKRGGCQRCGSVLRGRGVGYCWWCKTYSSGSVVSESPGSLWLMSQGALDVPCVDWRIAMHCGTVGAGSVGDSVATMLSESGGDALCVSDTLEDMHVSSQSSDSDVDFLDVLNNFDMCVSPISSDSDVQTLEVLRFSSRSYEELARSRVVCALGVLLRSDSFG